MLRSVIIIFLIPISLLCNLQNCFSEGSFDLSGKYKGYNVILIILDALRPDHLSCYGYGKETSPNIDKLARQGVLFKNAFSQASYTLPSVTSIFTSVYPYSHGVMHIFKDKVPEKLQTMAQTLKNYGYNTAWFGILDDPHSGKAEGQMKGFDEKFQLSTTRGAEIARDNQIIFNRIKKYNQERFFITIHSYSVHEVFFPKIRFLNKFSQTLPKDFIELLDSQEEKEWNYLSDILQKTPERVTSVFAEDLVKSYLMPPYKPGKFNELMSFVKTNEQKLFFEEINSNIDVPFLKSIRGENLAHILTLVDSAIYAVDNYMIGELVRQLKEYNLLDKTVIIITADHGNIYNEHGKFGHGPWLYDEVMRVPLIMYLPDLRKPAVISEFAQSIDILPTTLDLLGIGIPHQAQGISLVGAVEGRKNALRNKYVFSQGVPVGTAAIRSKDWKLFLKQGESGSYDERLFNLKKDPYEMNNVIKDNPEVVKQLKSRLNAWQNSLVIYREAETEFAAGVDEATKERIKNTGYW